MWRITKYNPIYRDCLGHYKKKEWTSYSDIGRYFDDYELTFTEYIDVENSYARAVSLFINSLNIQSLKVTNLEKNNNDLLLQEQKNLSQDMVDLYTDLKNNQIVNVNEAEKIVRMVLRELLWCKLECEDFYVHFGYDYYMYIGSGELCNEVVGKIRNIGLFVEKFGSPYNG